MFVFSFLVIHVKTFCTAESEVETQTLLLGTQKIGNHMFEYKASPNGFAGLLMNKMK